MTSVRESLQEKNMHQQFVVGVWLKALNALLEIIGGTLLLFTGAVTTFITYMARNELIEDPGDVVANTVQHHLPYLSQHSQLFTAIYLLSHGIIKIFLVAGLLGRRLWAYPSAIIVFVLFIVYQLYHYIHTHSFFLLLLTTSDILVIWLTWHEYKVIKKHMAF